MNALLVYPEFPDTFWSFKHAMKFINKGAANPPLGLITVAAMLPKEWTLKLIDLNISPLIDQDWDWADVIVISAMIVQRKSVTELIRKSKLHNKLIIAGGPLFTSEYEEFPEVDHFILNEAEITLPLFIVDLAQNKAKKIYKTDQFPDINSTPVPRFDLLELEKYDAMSLQYSRGCPYNCDFCNVTALFGHAPRIKSTDHILRELDALYQAGWRRNIFFVDDNFIGNKRVIKDEVLPALIQWRKDKVGCLFITEASINLADDPELLRLMAEAGFISVFVGIETPSEEGLVECHKTQNTRRDLISSVHKIQSSGIQVMAGFIIGFDSDDVSIFQKQFDFIQESGIITAMVGLLQAPFGTRLYDRMKADGRIIEEMTGDNADGTTNLRTKMDQLTLIKNYRKLMKELFSPVPFYFRIRTFLTHFRPLPMPVSLTKNDFLALLKTVWFMGITGPDRKEYWALIWWILTRMPSKFAMAITLTVYGYHFRQVAKLHLGDIAEKEKTSLSYAKKPKQEEFSKISI
jgi:radical SAM superfamily enzyme YgiQ (UPF0313 family)